MVSRPANGAAFGRLARHAWIRTATTFAIVVSMAVVATGCDTNESPNDSQRELTPTQGTGELAQVVPAHLKRVDFDDKANFLLIDDIDRDGYPDLVLTSHGGNYSQVFRQTAPRTFERLDRISAVGFHPNEFNVLSREPPLWVSCAEGESEMRIFAFDEGLSPRMVSSTPIRHPRFATPFVWPGYGKGLAVTPLKGSEVTLLVEFEPDRVRWRDALSVTVASKPIFFPSKVVPADIDGDSVDELLFTIPKESTLAVVRRPASAEVIKAEVLWSFPKRETLEYLIPADIDGARGIDLLVLGHPSPQVHVLLNNGDGTFESSAVKISGGGAIDGAFSTDKDGARYLLLAEPEQFVLMELAPNGTDVVWQGAASNGGRMAVTRVALTDLDVDGWLDAIIIRNGRTFNNAILYGPLKENFSDLALVATEQFYRDDAR